MEEKRKMSTKMTEQSADQEQQQQSTATTQNHDSNIGSNQHDKNDNGSYNESVQQQQTSCPRPQQQQQQQQQQSQHKQRRKLRVLVISMGGERQEIIKKMFSIVSNDFECPTFINGIPSRKLRNRNEFFYYANQAGLLPTNEYNALHIASTNVYYEQNPERLYECLADIPINNNNSNNNTGNSKRRGSEYDLQMHYSVELWKKAKTINRGRAVLACTFAHLIALKKLVTEQYDILLEDNVRMPIISTSDTTGTSTSTAADRIWNTINSIQEWEQQQQMQQNQHCKCHVRYFGWLGSVPNLNWIYDSHIPQKQFHRPSSSSTGNNQQQQTIVVFPLTQDIENDLKAKAAMESSNNNDDNITRTEEETTTTTSTSSSTTIDNNNNIDKNSNNQKQQQEDNELAQKMKSQKKKKQNNTVTKDKSQPGGSTVWGTYAYWISKDAYDCIIQTLQNDVGAMLWKSKKMKNYLVKPIDKIIPRTIISNLYPEQQVHEQVHKDSEETIQQQQQQQQYQYAVQIATCPSFFRAPMLTSKIHTQWDPEFCKSTTIQLQHTNLQWSDLYLSSNEQHVVQYYEKHTQWIPYSDIIPTATATAITTTTITNLTNDVATIELEESL